MLIKGPLKIVSYNWKINLFWFGLMLQLLYLLELSYVFLSIVF